MKLPLCWKETISSLKEIHLNFDTVSLILLGLLILQELQLVLFKKIIIIPLIFMELLEKVLLIVWKCFPQFY